MKTIRYNQGQLKSTLYLGFTFVIAGTVIATLHLLFGENKAIQELTFGPVGAGMIVGGLLTFVGYYYLKQRQYLTIKDGYLIKNDLIPRKVKLSEIRSIKRFAGDYTLKTDKTELRIETQVIDKESLKELDAELEKLVL